MNARTGVSGGKRGAAHEDGSAGIETRLGIVLLARVAALFRIHVFPDEHGAIGAFGDRNSCQGLT